VPTDGEDAVRPAQRARDLAPHCVIAAGEQAPLRPQSLDACQGNVAALTPGDQGSMKYVSSTLGVTAVVPG